MIRIGQGIDVHAFAAPGSGRKTFLGGVLVSEEVGLEGHSDADVLLHAVMDAVLGALSWGDIGHWFPNTDESYRGVASSILFETIWSKAAAEGWTVVNLDCSVLAERPKVGLHAELIKTSLASLFGCERSRIGLKATTTERLGFIGRGEGIAALAVLLIQKDGSDN